MSNTRTILATMFCLAILISCEKENVSEPFDLGYDFFPVETGLFIVYDVDSIGYGVTVDTAHYQVMELLADEFVDGLNQNAIAVERYRRNSESEEWSLTDVWTQKRTTSAALRTEENITYIRLAFPVEEDKSWNGNAYNTMPEWNYVINNLDATANYGDLHFSKTLTVNQRNYANLVDQEFAYEVYARDVGMIYKQLTDLTYQNGIVTGIDMTMTVVDYGKVQ